MSRYISSLKPTKSVLPHRSAGARRFPVGPRICFAISASPGWLFFRSNSTRFFPRATRIVDTFPTSARDSFSPSGSFFAFTSCFATTFVFARNSCARLQDVQPGRFRCQSIPATINAPYMRLCSIKSRPALNHGWRRMRSPTAATVTNKCPIKSILSGVKRRGLGRTVETFFSGGSGHGSQSCAEYVFP